MNYLHPFATASTQELRSLNIALAQQYERAQAQLLELQVQEQVLLGYLREPPVLPLLEVEEGKKKAEKKQAGASSRSAAAAGGPSAAATGAGGEALGAQPAAVLDSLAHLLEEELQEESAPPIDIEEGKEGRRRAAVKRVAKKKP